MANQQNRRQSIASQAEAGPGNAVEQRTIELNQLKHKVDGSEGFYRAITPAHANAQQFIAVVKGILNKDPDLAAAAMANPNGFLSTLADCAQLGLTPGRGYAITHRRNRTTGIPDIVGIVEYQGEIELMFRTGRVTAVVAEVVRVKDDFKRGATPTEPPMWEPVDEGFAGVKARGILRGVFAYAVIDGQYTTKVVYLGPEAIAARRAKAGMLKIWGPEWPAEGENTENMWRKSGVRALWPWVPKSAEYVAQLMAQAAQVASADVPPGMILGTGDAPPMITGTTAPAGEDEPPAAAPPAADERARIVALLDTIGVQQDQRGRTVAALSGAAEGARLTPGQQADVLRKLETCADGAKSTDVMLGRLAALVESAENAEAG
jgi:recombination protein RecT